MVLPMLYVGVHVAILCISVCLSDLLHVPQWDASWDESH
jgi:hypothetical protein